LGDFKFKLDKFEEVLLKLLRLALIFLELFEPYANFSSKFVIFSNFSTDSKISKY